MLVQDFLQQSASRLPTKTALVVKDRRWTFGELNDAANRLALVLQERIRAGDRVVIYLGNSAEAVVSIFATLKAGGVFVVLNRTTKPDKLAFVLNDCRASVLIMDQRAAQQGLGLHLLTVAGSLTGILVSGEAPNGSAVGNPRLRYFKLDPAPPASFDPAAQVAEGDLACLIYTSGTTGEPKGVMCEHRNVVFVTRAIVQYLNNFEDDVILSVLALSFSYGLYQLMATMCVGATLVLEDSFAFPAKVLERMAQERVTGFAGVPTIYSIILGMDLSGLDVSNLRYLTNAAAGLPVEHVSRLRQRFPQVQLFLMHGLTEVARSMYLPPSEVDRRPGASGIALPGTQLWIEDEAGRRVGSGEVGELVICGPHVMRGYWGNPERTAERFRPGPRSGERICYSGDLFRTDEDGYFYFISRKDDIIKSRGEKVAPREIENVLYGIPGVVEAAVIGVPDPLLGQAVKAFVVAPGTHLTESSVIAHCRAKLEDIMVPRLVEFRDSLPKSANGKIRKLELS